MDFLPFFLKCAQIRTNYSSLHFSKKLSKLKQICRGLISSLLYLYQNYKESNKYFTFKQPTPIYQICQKWLIQSGFTSIQHLNYSRLPNKRVVEINVFGEDSTLGETQVARLSKEVRAYLMQCHITLTVCESFGDTTSSSLNCSRTSLGFCAEFILCKA